MSGVSRIGDVGQGTCPSHDSPRPYITVFNTGASTVTAEGMPVVRVGDVGISTCGHPTVALTGAPISTVEGIIMHRQGDTGANSGPYVALGGAVTVGGN